jgi:hypothetical protein
MEGHNEGYSGNPTEDPGLCVNDDVDGSMKESIP